MRRDHPRLRRIYMHHNQPLTNAYLIAGVTFLVAAQVWEWVH